MSNFKPTILKEKEQQIQQIVKTMRQHDISLKDIAQAIPTHSFDLRCNIKGTQVRLPFEQGKNHDVIGIYPFPNVDLYIYTQEGKEEDRSDTWEDKLVPLEIWQCLFQIKEALNNCLSELGLPIFEGLYFARHDYDNWVVNVTIQQIENKDYQPIKAKARYCDGF